MKQILILGAGLPALESNNNPLGYKFSWSPEGAMLAATNDGRYLEHGIVLLAVNNLSCELPNDASSFFSNQLKPLVPNLLKADYDRTLETSGLRPEIQKAVIVYNGRLTKDYEYLNAHLK